MFARTGVVERKWSSTEYRRHARHLRKLYADEPARLHRQLGELAKRHDAWREAKGNDGPHIPVANQATVVRRRTLPELRLPRSPCFVSDETLEAFSRQAAQHLDGSILRYSERVALLRTAERMGIGRFHANLLIALVQHHAGIPSTQVMRPTSYRPPSWVIPLALGILAQAIIVWGAWEMFCAR